MSHDKKYELKIFKLISFSMIRKTLFFICTAIITVGFFSCAQQEKSDKISPELIENPATASGESKEGKVPVFEFETTNHHFGEIKEGDIVTFTFKFKNKGNADLFIITAKASCGCTIPAYSKEGVHPGDEGKVDVSFDSHGKSGMVSKTITVIANTIPNTKVLTISAEITGK
jgi:hypothetical protein